MVSQIPYRSFKELDLRHSYGTLVIVVFAVALLIQEPSLTLFAIGLGYAFSGPAEWLWRWFTRRPLERVPEPLVQESAQG
jgi:phosphatidylserine synthase